MIPRLKRPRTPPELLEAGWHLCSLPGGHWWCVNPAIETETPIATAPGRAIEAALRLAEPDHERITKWWREHEQVRLVRKIWKARAYG